MGPLCIAAVSVGYACMAAVTAILPVCRRQTHQTVCMQYLQVSALHPQFFIHWQPYFFDPSP